MRVHGIDGEAKGYKHKVWIELTSFSEAVQSANLRSRRNLKSCGAGCHGRRNPEGLISLTGLLDWVRTDGLLRL